ncbi:NAD(P)H-quinone oxidoreductase subunit T, chloroplastic [Solanum pennellii]|uniref:NAD(P)H-quinone oxidoreductase subunit T, chloroplastic n=1 Tax=Solanum pennellii TaxID=28526 RepID=A0ABM1HQ36_SOLPN|nr:NAD(P)H-quinone oxidoreductase subunit T, chloroplastic [Solanum pennellii]
MRKPLPLRLLKSDTKQISNSMASATAPPAPFTFLTRNQTNNEHRTDTRWLTRKQRRRRVGLQVYAKEEGATGRQRAPPGVDTRIHWENEDEGWVGESKSRSTQERIKTDEKNLFDEKFSDLLNSSANSHYQFLGVSATADLEEIKAAYRRLSKEYHPDTTNLPIRAASEKFMKLREIYDVLSDEEQRRFYDWTLAQETASREAEKMKMRLQDPRMLEVENWESVPDMVDRLGGRNMELSNQAKTALTFDILIIIFSFCCIIYAVVFKEQY